MAPQHEATGGRVRIGLCPVEHTVWFDVRGVLRFCAGFSCDESARRGAGGADMVKVQRPWQRPGPHRKDARVVELRFRRCVIMCARSVPGRQTEREFIRI